MDPEAWIGISAAAIAAIAAVFSFLQARSARSSAISAEKQLEQARLQAAAAERQAVAAELQVAEMRAQSVAFEAEKSKANDIAVRAFVTRLSLIWPELIQDTNNLTTTIGDRYPRLTGDEPKPYWSKHRKNTYYDDERQAIFEMGDGLERIRIKLVDQIARDATQLQLADNLEGIVAAYLEEATNAFEEIYENLGKHSSDDSKPPLQVLLERQEKVDELAQRALECL